MSVFVATSWTIRLSINDCISKSVFRKIVIIDWRLFSQSVFEQKDLFIIIISRLRSCQSVYQIFHDFKYFVVSLSHCFAFSTIGETNSSFSFQIEQKFNFASASRNCLFYWRKFSASQYCSFILTFAFVFANFQTDSLTENKCYRNSFCFEDLSADESRLYQKDFRLNTTSNESHYFY